MNDDRSKTKMLQRLKRAFCIVSVGLAVPIVTIGVAGSQPLSQTVTAWEKRLDARVGVMLRHVSSDWEWAYRDDERFPMCSTFKSLLCGAILARVDTGDENLADNVMYLKEDLVTYSPITQENVGTGMSVGKLCEAAITMSDNSAANLLLKRVGGPEGLTDFLRGIGDAYSRLDRWEPELNESVPGDLRDTTTPRAIVASLEQLLFGDVLRQRSASLLKQWMIDDKIADGLIRAHLPDEWEIGDKTGAGENGSRGIIAFLVAPEDEIYIAAIYLTESDADFSLRNEVIAEIGRAMIAEIKAR